MNLIQSLIRGCITPFIICLVVLTEWSLGRPNYPNDIVHAGTVWKGELVYDKTDYSPASKPYVMILYIKKRKNGFIEGVTWYPTEDNGLLKVTGRVGEKGSIFFKEEKVIHGKSSAKKRTGVQAGNRFTGRLDKNTIKGSGQWTGPAFNGKITMKFSLKIAQ